MIGIIIRCIIRGGIGSKMGGRVEITIGCIIRRIIGGRIGSKMGGRIESLIGA
jgi:hypothetical protein